MNLNDPQVREAGARALWLADKSPVTRWRVRGNWDTFGESGQSYWLECWDFIAAEIAPLLEEE